MGDEDKRAYENRVVSFFLLRLPATAAPQSKFCVAAAHQPGLLFHPKA